MTPLKIGACLAAAEIATYRDWLFDADRDIELQDFFEPVALLSELEDRVAAAKAALDGHRGRVGIHAPFMGLPIDGPDPEIAPLITARYLSAVEAADCVGARQMVLHSPFDAWFENNFYNYPGVLEAKQDQVHTILGPVVRAAEVAGITLVLENILDVDPSRRRILADSFGSDAVAVSIDTGHAQLARRLSGAPPVDYFVRDAGAKLAHVHIQDVDGHADRHWAPGDGEIEWAAVFRALAEGPSQPHLVLELRDKADIPKGFAHLQNLGLAA